MRAVLEDRWFRAFAETNDQRRCAGQALHYLHRTLLLGYERGKGFAGVVRAWAPGAAALFASLETRLRRLAMAGRDDRLRRWLANVLARLADDLDGGDRRIVPFARWLEARFPELTALMRGEPAGSRLHDADLARGLALAFAACGRSAKGALAGPLRAAAADLAAKA